MTKKIFKPNARWMSLGASPSAPDFCNIDVDYVAVGGPGIELRMPDVYLIAERSEIFKWYDYTTEMQSQGGHLLVTSFILNYLKVGGEEIGSHLTPWPYHLDKSLIPDDFPYDEIVPVRSHPRHAWTDYKHWIRGNLCMCTCGTMAMLYAIRAKASEIHMVGLEGYNGVDDYFDKEHYPSSRRSAQHFQEYTLPFIHMIVKACPDIKFFHYGTPRFDLDYSNVVVVSNLESMSIV